MLKRTLYAFLACLLILTGCETPPCVDGWVGAPPPEGTSQYCVRKTDDGRELRHGPYTRWHFNGQISAQGQYLDGKEEGVWTYWHPNGKISEHGRFHDGKEAGRWIRHYPEGSIWKQSDYLEGKLHGLEIVWWVDGNRSSECSYLYGERHGPCTRWDSDGDQIFSGRYASGKPEGVVMRRTFENTSYCDFRDGVLHGRCEMIFNREGVTVVVPYLNGKVDGRLDAWSGDGVRLGESYFQDGQLHGRSVMWYRDGTLMESGYFEDGKPQGMWTLWQSSGQISSEGSFDKGKREGLWLYYDWQGEVFEVHCEKGSCPDGFYFGGPTAQHIPGFLNRSLSGHL